jgi:hypothetical protein
MNFVLFLPSLGKLATFTPLSTAPLVVAVASGLSVSPRKRMPRRLARKWTVLASTAEKSVLCLRGTRDPWMSERAEVQVDLLPGAEAAPLVAIDVALPPMNQSTRKYNFQTLVVPACPCFISSVVWRLFAIHSCYIMLRRTCRLCEQTSALAVSFSRFSQQSKTVARLNYMQK